MTRVKHISHLEDLLLENRIDTAISMIYNLCGDNKLEMSTKWDGAPSIFAGTDPEDNAFFVACKSIFNRNPKIYKTISSIMGDSIDPGLKDKLAKSLVHMREMNIKGVLQGDFIYTKEDLFEMDIASESFLAFHPNILVYAVPKKSEIASRILASDLGVVWHTVYSGRTLGSMQKDFTRTPESCFTEIKEVFSLDPTLDSRQYGSNPEIIYNGHEDLNMTNWLSNLYNRELLQTQINSYIKQNDRFNDCDEFVKHINDGVLGRYVVEWEKRKTDAGRGRMRAKYMAYTDFCYSFKFKNLMEMYIKVSEFKDKTIAAISNMSEFKVFLKTEEGYVSTNHEGYVINDDENVVKLVNRFDFSAANFNKKYIRGWELKRYDVMS